MPATQEISTPTVYPCLFYRDAPAAIKWLGDAFGFETMMCVPGDGPGTVAHSEMRLGAGWIMLGTAKADSGWKSPLDLPAVNQMLYIVIDDVDAHCARAKAAGAEIIREPVDEDYGGRDYMARDPEGNYWSFGTYRPGA